MVLLRNLISKDETLKSVFKDKIFMKMNYLIKGVSSNSKDIKKDYIFVALKGNKFDGSNFIIEAKKNDWIKGGKPIIAKVPGASATPAFV